MIPLTFTGVDEQTNLDDLVGVVRAYRPKVELAVLIGSRTKEDYSNESFRYPCLPFIVKFRNFCMQYDIPCALHLCGKYARTVNEINDEIDVQRVLDLCLGFSRVQVNARQYEPELMRTFARACPARRVILQHRNKFDVNVPLLHGKVEYLFDSSGGRGIDSIRTWPMETHDHFRCGFAGGVNRDNIGTAVRHALATRSPVYNPESDSWIDMETGVREMPADRFMVDYVEEICNVVEHECNQ